MFYIQEGYGLVLSNYFGIIEGILEKERQQGADQGEGEEDYFITCSVAALKSTVMNLFNLQDNYDNSAVLEGALTVAKELIFMYVTGLHQLVKDKKRDLPHSFLLAVSNNVAEAEEMLNDVCDRAIELSENKLDYSDCEGVLQSGKILKMWQLVGESALKKLVDSKFDMISALFECSFSKLNFEHNLELINESYGESIEKVTLTTRKMLFKNILKDIQIFYLRCVMKNKADIDQDLLVKRMNMDISCLRDWFGGVMTYETDSLLQALSLFREFYAVEAEDYSSLPLVVEKLIRELKGIFTLQTVKSMLVMRRDLDSSQKEEIIEAVVEIIPKDSKGEGIKTLTSLIITEESYDCEEVKIEENPRRRETLNLDAFLDEEEDEVVEVRNVISKKRNSLLPQGISDTKMDGYLVKESPYALCLFN